MLFVSASKEILLVNEREKGQDDDVPPSEACSDKGGSGDPELAGGDAEKGQSDSNDGISEAGPAPPPVTQRDKESLKNER